MDNAASDFQKRDVVGTIISSIDVVVTIIGAILVICLVVAMVIRKFKSEGISVNPKRGNLNVYVNNFRFNFDQGKKDYEAWRTVLGEYVSDEVQNIIKKIAAQNQTIEASVKTMANSELQRSHSDVTSMLNKISDIAFRLDSYDIKISYARDEVMRAMNLIIEEGERNNIKIIKEMKECAQALDTLIGRTSSIAESKCFISTRLHETTSRCRYILSVIENRLDPSKLIIGGY